MHDTETKSCQDLTWNAHDEAVRIDGELPECDWATIRRAIQTIRQKFVEWQEEDERRAKEAVAEASQPDDSGCDEVQRDLLEWTRAHLPTHTRKPASEMHRWMAEHLDRMTAERASGSGGDERGRIAPP